MGLRKWLKIVGVLGGLAALAACATEGDVVRVSTVEHTGALAPADRAELAAIRESEASRGEDPGVKGLLAGTPRYSVAEYRARYPEATDAAAREYRVGGQDVLSITVYEEPDLCRESVPVAADGYLSFPLIGRMQVGGLTTSEVERRISDRLAQEQYLLEAHVAVMVKEYNSQRFMVLGAVNLPGTYPLKAQEQVLDGISRAGGVDFEDAGQRAMLIRTRAPGAAEEAKIVIEIDLQGLLKGRDQRANLYLADRDLLYVPATEHFYIIGQVNQPGSFPLEEGETSLVEAVGMAGGFTRIANRGGVRIIRVEDGVERLIEVNVDAITKGGKKIQDIDLKPGDIIVVPESFF